MINLSIQNFISLCVQHLFPLKIEEYQSKEEIVTEWDPMGSTQDRIPTPNIFCPSLVCRKDSVSRASPESQKAASRINDQKNVSM